MIDLLKQEETIQAKNVFIIDGAPKIDIQGSKIDHLSVKQKRYLPVKRAIDIVLSGGAILFLSPILGTISLAIKLESPGPVLFKQKRIGQDHKLFEIWKFRSMRTSTPNDVPTHMLADPERYITKIGKFLRKTSLDELPQIFNIFKGQMSIIGPRPALWNQYDLIEERDKYGANDIMPGLTGWAQINGRDELEIPVKAKFDGEYVEKMGPGMDIKCLLGTIGSILCSDGVIEGGTGNRNIKNNVNDVSVSKEKLKREMRTGVYVVGLTSVIGIGSLWALIKCLKNRSCILGMHEYHLRKVFLCTVLGESVATVYTNIKRRVKLADSFVNDETSSSITTDDIDNVVVLKKVLITGADSYIGTSLENWLMKQSDKYEVMTVDMQTNTWKETDFSVYDVVYHVAGIAHADIGVANEEQKQLYYKVNTKLAIEVAELAKKAGVKQFIFMSSMIVYSGCKEKFITKYTIPSPLNVYGDSKLQAEQKIMTMTCDSFRVVILRPPMIYGKNSKGNYPELVKLATVLPLFPIVKNKRSMLHIDNLCEFVKLMIDYNESGVFFPQNKEYTNTTHMVQIIAETKGHRIIMLPGTNVITKIVCKIPGKVGALASKAFGDFAYDMGMSDYKVDYRVNSLRRSIELTEERTK